MFDVLRHPTASTAVRRTRWGIAPAESVNGPTDSGNAPAESPTPREVAALVAALSAIARRAPTGSGSQARLAALSVLEDFPAADDDSATIDTAHLGLDDLLRLADDLARTHRLPQGTAHEVQRRLARARVAAG